MVKRDLFRWRHDHLRLAHQHARKIAPAALRFVALGQCHQRLGMVGPQG